MPNISTDLLELAARFVNSTASHIFLTGKAGTGKTTFLRDLARKTHKSFVIVAPTGIAALNAQGVTIHSQFLFPMGSFIPDRDYHLDHEQAGGFFTQNLLARKHPLNSARKQVLRAADLIVIDEVSMLRADILDAMDYRMRSAKGNYHRSFGGAQVLMIGDLFQLPPIVKDHEWRILSAYYKSIHFFEAQALKKDGFVYIELDKIFRQSDDAFIRILNNLRNNVPTQADIAELNKHYRPADEIDEEGVITITTHNYKADKINQEELDALPGPSSFFTADIQGDFPESMYPLPETLDLKVGAQIMFIKNDASGQGEYYNGKLARIDYIDDDGVTVIMADTRVPFVLRKEKWENKRYTVNADTKELDENVIGTFVQFPVKLAWAVTVHKSQGLTFDKAIIDVGQAFAPGQVYVALSRLRSLEGLILRTHINPNGISSDAEVVNFSIENNQKEALPHKLQQSQQDYLQRILATTFDFSPLESQFDYFLKDEKGADFEVVSMRGAVPAIAERIRAERPNTEKFRNQLLGLLYHNQPQQLQERLSKGSQYYKEFMRENLRQLFTHMADVERFSRVRQYFSGLEELDQMLMKTLGEIERAVSIATAVLNGQDIVRDEHAEQQRVVWRQQRLGEARDAARENPALATTKSGRKRKKGESKLKEEKGATFKTTYSLVKEGMSLKEIAESRGMALSTIEGHAVKGIREGELKVRDVLPDAIITMVSNAFAEHKSLPKVFESFDKKVSYDVIRMVQASLDS
jgi:hypothetical protein